MWSKHQLRPHPRCPDRGALTGVPYLRLKQGWNPRDQCYRVSSVDHHVRNRQQASSSKDGISTSNNPTAQRTSYLEFDIYGTVMIGDTLHESLSRLVFAYTCIVHDPLEWPSFGSCPGLRALVFGELGIGAIKSTNQPVYQRSPDRWYWSRNCLVTFSKSRRLERCVHVIEPVNM